MMDDERFKAWAMRFPLLTDHQFCVVLLAALDAALDSGIINPDDRVFEARRKAVRYANESQ